MKPLKQPLSYSDQIARLREAHGLTIDDEAEALEILARVNYYRLSAYGIGLRRAEDPEKYRDGITLRHLYRLYQFDMRLRSALLHLIEHVEIGLRTQIAYHLAMTYGSEGYRDVSNFEDRPTARSASIHSDTMEKLDAEIRRQDNLPYVKHHKHVYGGHFPIWVAVELFTFGMLSSLYSIMKPRDKKSIASVYGVHPKHLESWIITLVEIRNRCAHYGRLYNMPFNQTPFLFSEYARYRKAQNKLFPVILVLKRITEGQQEWLDFLKALEALFIEYPEADPGFMNFPPDWKEVLEKSREASI